MSELDYFGELLASMVDGDEPPGLSRPGSGAGRMQRLVLGLLRQHQTRGELPTSSRFLFYELLSRGVVSKSGPGESRRGTADHPREQEVIDAVMAVRRAGAVPWSWIADETRRVREWEHSPTVLDFTRRSVDVARLNPWHPAEPPLILTESRSLAGVLAPVAAEYVCPVASTNGQVGGWLRTDVAPLLPRPVLYCGDLDLSGDLIEANTQRVLERSAGALPWRRVAITSEQVSGHKLTPITKQDRRYRPPRKHLAVETEALGQGVVVSLVREALDDLLPEPLANVRERERQQRTEVARKLDGGR